MNEQEKQRKEVALALMLKDGHQPEDIGDWRKSVYAKKADEFIEQHSEDGLCPKCLGTGFIEKEHGLFRPFCDCEKGIALRVEITGETSEETLTEVAADANAFANALMPRLEGEATPKPKPHKHHYRKDGTCKCGAVLSEKRMKKRELKAKG